MFTFAIRDEISASGTAGQLRGIIGTNEVLSAQECGGQSLSGGGRFASYRAIGTYLDAIKSVDHMSL